MRKRKFVTLALGLALCLSACGSQPETVTDYGGTSTQKTVVERSSDIAGEGETESGAPEGTEDTEGTTSAGTSQGKLPALPPVQLDGEPIWESTFALDKKPVNISIKSLLRDTDKPHSYQLKTLTDDPEYEKETVKRLFGDSAKELHGEISEANGDVPEVVDMCMAYSGMDLNQKRETDAVSAWVDEKDYTYHTYEGYFNDVECQMVIVLAGGYMRQIIMGPKNPGDAIGAPECKEYYSIQNHLNGENYEIWGKAIVLNVMSDRPNRTVSSDEELLTKVKTFAKDMLQVDIDPEDLKLTKGEETGNATKQEIVFLTEDSESSATLEGAIRDGYFVEYDMGHAGSGYSMCNNGMIAVTDKGVMGFSMTLGFEIESVLADNVELLPFDKVMDAFQRGLQENFDTSKINGSKLDINTVDFLYYPAYSDEKPNEATLVPAWRFHATSNGEIGEVYINAIDGSWIMALYK